MCIFFGHRCACFSKYKKSVNFLSFLLQQKEVLFLGASFGKNCGTDGLLAFIYREMMGRLKVNSTALLTGKRIKPELNELNLNQPGIDISSHQM
jgi:hypothetical protein